MGVRSTGSHPTTTKADGHLLEYFRQNFGAGGGANKFHFHHKDYTASGGVISDYTDPDGTMFTEHTFLHIRNFCCNSHWRNIGIRC